MTVLRFDLHHLARLAAAAMAAAALAQGAAHAATPSFDCSKRINAAEKMVCGDDTLAALDRKLGGIVSQAGHSLPRDKSIAYFVVEQQEWVRSRDGCPSTPRPEACLMSVYRTRIAELQDRFNLVPSRGPYRFACNGSPPADLVVTWFETDPPSGMLETASGTTTIFSVQSASGARYIGENVTFWEHQGSATLAYANPAQQLDCTQKSGPAPEPAAAQPAGAAQPMAPAPNATVIPAKAGIQQ
jgi:uncharacterized protein